MIHRVILFFAVATILAGVLFIGFTYLRPKTITTTLDTPAPTVEPTSEPVKETKTIFIPYWTCLDTQNEDVSTYDRFIYFGVEGGLDGVNFSEQGYKALPKCIANFSSIKNKYLAVRMLNSDNNFTILKDEKMQKKIIDESMQTAQKYGFNGIVLDLEFTDYFYSKTPENINSFTSNFYSAAKQNNVSFAILLYGDTFYRHRPFDLKSMSQNADEFMIMAYDFHKSRGEPGPNFPYIGLETYNYDFQTMVGDFLHFLPANKVTITYGLYGYDWYVDDTKKPIRPATAVTYNQVKKSFLDTCKWKNCVVIRDPKAAETEVDYVDEKAGYHVIWFEDIQSAQTKIDFARQKGIGGVAFWAYGYY